MISIRSQLATVLLAAAAAGCSTAPEPPPPKPNIVVLVIDALRADRLGFAGYPRPTSPQLDRLAAEGVWFRDAYAQATWTKPSIGSLLTSRYPSELGLLDLDFQRDPRATKVLGATWPYLPERLQLAGWRTGASINQVHLSANNGFGRGFDDFLHFRGRDGFEVNRSIEPFLDGGEPLFAYVHYLDVHWPYQSVLAETEGLFGERRFAVPPPRSGLSGVDRWRRAHLDERALTVLGNRYDAEIRYADAAAGQLFDALRQRGLWQNTIVVVTSDHGEGFLEHDQIMHGFPAYREVSRVPLIVRLPERYGFPRGERATPVALVDLAPTLADLAAIEPDPEARGESLRDVLAGRERPERSVLTQSEDAWALRDGRHAVLAFSAGRIERYDLVEDPVESRPLSAAACGEPCQKLESRLRRLIARYGASAATEQESGELSAEELEELQALGYL
jgi:arylsulfatase A-like enzyme